MTAAAFDTAAAIQATAFAGSFVSGLGVLVSLAWLSIAADEGGNLKRPLAVLAVALVVLLACVFIATGIDLEAPR